jgi:hypothetical protein
MQPYFWAVGVNRGLKSVVRIKIPRLCLPADQLTNVVFDTLLEECTPLPRLHGSASADRAD